jgi:hypothetical protein
LLPLAYEITRTMILRQFGAAQLALERQCWSKIAETIVHQVKFSERRVAELQFIESSFSSLLTTLYGQQIQAIVSCQTFTLIGVAGSLVGSVPLFAEVEIFLQIFCLL